MAAAQFVFVKAPLGVKVGAVFVKVKPAAVPKNQLDAGDWAFSFEQNNKTEKKQNASWRNI